MPRPTPRPFGLLDAVILIAAVAVGLAWHRFLGWSGYGINARHQAYWSVAKDWVIRVAFMTDHFAYPLTLGLIVVRLRSPRPRLRAVWSQPGASACLAVLIAATIRAITLAGDLFDSQISTLREYANFIASAYSLLPEHKGLAVAVAWITLIAVGRFRPEGGWIDRAGRVVAAFYLGCLALNVVKWW